MAMLLQPCCEPFSGTGSRRVLHMLAGASLNIPLLICLKLQVVDVVVGGERESWEKVCFGIWLVLCLLVSLRAACVFVSLLRFQWVAGMAKRLAAHLSFHVAFCHFLASMVYGGHREILLAVLCVFMGMANVMLERRLLQRSEVLRPMRHAQVTLECNLERDHYTHKLERGGTACVVCLGDFQEGDEVARLPCGHNFHENCVRRWLWNHKQCPYRCSANTAQKRKQWEARKNIADEAAEGGENYMESDVETSIDEEIEWCGVNSPCRSTSCWGTH